ncbi:transient receptor potential cation channel subfamily A member 1-like, partial [Diabrotica undecimpunctata]|uniref:transient receptor potential cation channel subfamily A member 1-like n=1 Tax=Diabrotica undecimpunctata TaxID=50387 RepID=UPI003B633AB1
ISEFGACPKIPCNNGYYPIHEAAKNASSKTLEVFLQWGESRGCSRQEMISFYDSEGNVPLHSAVHGGDIKAVELCIKSGAKISIQQQDLSTPVHLACAQGATEIVKIMFKMQPEEKLPCLQSCDVQKMTPLHCAAMFDHPEIVEYLVSEGADINVMDKERRSPMLLAALRGGWRTVHTLIRLGADINIKDVNRRNVLHLVVMNGGRLEKFASEVSEEISAVKTYPGTDIGSDHKPVIGKILIKLKKIKCREKIKPSPEKVKDPAVQAEIQKILNDTLKEKFSEAPAVTEESVE